MSSSSSAPTPEDINELVARWLKAELDGDARARRRSEIDREAPWHAGAILRSRPEGEPDQVLEWLDGDQLDTLLDASPAERAARMGPDDYLLTDVNEAHIERGLRHDASDGAQKRLDQGDVSAARGIVAGVLVREGIDLDREGDAFDSAVRQMARAQATLREALRRRDVRYWRPGLDEDPAASLMPVIKAVLPSVDARGPAVASSAPSRRASTAFTIGAAEALEAIAKAEAFRPKRRDDYQNAIDTFIDFLGRDPALGAITPEIAGDYQVALGRYPTNPRKRPEYRDLKTFAERCARAEEEGGERLLSAETINGKYLTPLRRICGWHQRAGSGLQNPFVGIAAPKSRKSDPKNKRRDFTVAELQRLFDLPLFTGAAGERGTRLYRPGQVRVNDWRYWVPLICIFSGMRLNEACGLAIADLKEEAGVPYFHVRDEVEGQSLKAPKSRRRVPVHEQLVRLGLLERVNQLRSSGAERLFDDLEVDANGYFSGTPSKFFLDLIARIKDPSPDEPGKLVFHSMRHTVTTRMRAADVRIDVAEAIVGHESNSTHSGYGSFDIPTLKAAVDKIKYPGLDLTRLSM